MLYEPSEATKVAKKAASALEALTEVVRNIEEKTRNRDSRPGLVPGYSSARTGADRPSPVIPLPDGDPTADRTSKVATQPPYTLPV